MSSRLSKAILKTLAYADIFNCPLTLKEIDRFLVTPKRIEQSQIRKAVEELVYQERVFKKKAFFYLRKKGSLVVRRQERIRQSRRKLFLAKRVALILRVIPWIRLVGVSGAVAVENANRKDDIDLLIVTAPGRLWLTRFLTVLLVEIIARRRRPNEKKVTDKICLNIFLDEKNLVFPRKRQDLFLAHEVVQLKLLWSRGDTYQRFLKQNQWVRRWLANGYPRELQLSNRTKRKKGLFFDRWEKLAYRWQLKYMKMRRTKELVSPGAAFFHPQDNRQRVMLEYKKRLAKLKL